ncbi:MAG: crossover junction endodeoxyribonuclease RuvC [Acidobacteriaceae bacterium]
MRVCGIDCGTETTGYGVVECDDRSTAVGQLPHLFALDAGGICPPRKAPLPERLAFIHAQITVLLEQHRPDVVAVEGVFYSVNAKSAIKLGHVRGVALLAAANAGIPVAEYAPLTIKSTVTGYGLAAKQQVQFMVARLLSLTQVPEPPDAADALAIAICHIHHAQTLSLQEARAV